MVRPCAKTSPHFLFGGVFRYGAFCYIDAGATPCWVKGQGISSTTVYFVAAPNGCVPYFSS